ncbi:MAG: PHP domain-containing protein [Erysipelotrichales bacterium]|nr:PHP domain-containing protein [Erysipelotrichales bacterium]
MKNYIDLHVHSMYSDDGEYTPKQLVEMCHEKGIRIMAIADHNSVKAIDEASQKAQELGMQYIPAVEIDCTYEGINLHVLGYGIDYKHEDFVKLEENVLNQELACSMKKLELTNQLGFKVTKKDLDQLSSNGVYTGEMFGEVLLGKEEYKDHELLKPYREGGDRSDNPYVNFYWDFYAQGKPCYTEIVYPSLKETITLIHKHGGKAVLAHPGNNLKGKFEIFDEMMKLGYDGVECFSNYHTSDTVEYFFNKGKEYGIMTTCGSDFHGKTKPAIDLGECRCPYDEEFIEEVLIYNGLIR